MIIGKCVYSSVYSTDQIECFEYDSRVLSITVFRYVDSRNMIFNQISKHNILPYFHMFQFKKITGNDVLCVDATYIKKRHYIKNVENSFTQDYAIIHHRNTTLLI